MTIVWGGALFEPRCIFLQTVDMLDVISFKTNCMLSCVTNVFLNIQIVGKLLKLQIA